MPFIVRLIMKATYSLWKAALELGLEHLVQQHLQAYLKWTRGEAQGRAGNEDAATGSQLEGEGGFHGQADHVTK
jgi:hypothetical protein